LKTIWRTHDELDIPLLFLITVMIIIDKYGGNADIRTGTNEYKSVRLVGLKGRSSRNINLEKIL
jgi:hypothetical protein